ncbi:MAG TPA: type II secretion system protein [Burkholderiales bacterium]|nr:type II secretion system protein [Burkholderiales bacterium]
MRRASGWSLVEIILVIVILGTLAVFVAPVLMRALGAYRSIDDTVATFAKLRYATERIAREIREVRRDPASSADYHFTSMTPTNATFFKLDGTQVAITSAAGTVTVNYIGTASGLLTDRVAAFAFAYLQQDGTTPATGVGDVAFVELGMTLSDGSASYPSRMRIDLRNLP